MPLHLEIEPSGGPLNRMFGRGTPLRSRVSSAALSMKDRIPSPSFDDAWLSYRQNALYSVMWVTVPEVMQPTAVTALATEPACAAVNDLDGLAGLGLD